MPAMLTPAVAEDPADRADDARAVVVAEERQVLGGLEVDVEAVDLDEPLDAAAMPISVPETETCEPSARVPRSVIRLRWSGLSASVTRRTRDAALGGEQRRVDVGDRLLDDVGEDALERGELEHLDVVLGDLAAHLDVELLRRPRRRAR